jgi:AmmeMemoRadiSam system protein A
MFTEPERRSLVAIARTAVIEAVSGCRAGAAAPENPGVWPGASGAFVTLKLKGRLRGCIGTLECHRPMDEEIARVAVSAAREDPRFDPLLPAELDDLHVEVSVLGPLEEIDPREPGVIEIGRHGLVVEQGHRRGVLLPQVAPEWGWDRDQFLSQTCAKAGLPPDAWRRGARVYRFTADVFGG